MRMMSRRSVIFTKGFFLGLLLFLAANLYSYYRMPVSSTMDDGFVSFGFPFELYAYGGFFTHSVILWAGLIADISIAVCASIIFG